MKFETGFFDNGVLQRNEKDCCEQNFNGTCKSAGIVLVSVLKKGKIVAGLSRMKAGCSAKGKFSGTVSGVPAGGPYDFQFSIADGSGKEHEPVTVKNILVGDLWILAGQSNMQGCGRMEHALASEKNVRAYYMNNRWDVAQDPIHNLYQACAPVHGGNPEIRTNKNPVTGVGPGVAFGHKMWKNTKVPQGLIACGHGGTSMEQWDPAKKKLGDQSLYGAAINRLKRLGGKTAGILWYQGCNETSAALHPLYTKRMQNLVSNFRKDAASPALPFVMVQLGRYSGIGCSVSWDSIREQQRVLPGKIRNLLTVPAIDLELDDPIHISGESQHVLGKRLACAMTHLVSGGKKGKAPIELKSIKITQDAVTRNAVIIVSFKHVDGKLAAAGRPAGFSLFAGDAPVSGIFKVALKKNDVIIYTSIYSRDFVNSKLCYGAGLDPYCNITDESGRPLPAFSANMRSNARPVMNFVSEFEVSAPVYVQESRENMKYPAKSKAPAFRKADFNAFYVSHPDREKLADGKNKIFYFRCRIKCGEAMDLNFLLGYDGPVKMFCDGKEIYCDMKGTNPIIRDHHKAPCSLGKGAHEIVIALASNRGAAWGICLRAERAGGKKTDMLPAAIPV
ncbi:MAG: sialate O-acetylesterase [Victivallaceae bacterium]|jgi:sialate O-acetylesterase